MSCLAAEGDSMLELFGMPALVCAIYYCYLQSFAGERVVGRVLRFGDIRR